MQGTAVVPWHLVQDAAVQCGRVHGFVLEEWFSRLSKPKHTV